MQTSMDHQKIFKFQTATIDSNFPSGNLSCCQEINSTNYNLWIGNDPKSNYRTWFYFSFETYIKKPTITFTIKNMSNQAKIFKEGLVPVFRNENEKWERIKIPVLPSSFTTSNNGFEFQWKHCFENEKVYFAFTYPWGLDDWEVLGKQLEQCFAKRNNCYFNRSILSYSLENRPVELITITNLTQNIIKQDLKPIQEGIFKSNPPRSFNNKKGIFISARVHPGQVPSSHIFNGVIKSLMIQSSETIALLNECVLYLVPFINPDGVYRGLYRSNTRGQNLNRHYSDPDFTLHPEIFSIKKFVQYYVKNEKLQCCLDLHAHAAKKGCFIYGNSVNKLKKQIDICLLPKLLSLNNPDFDYDACNFTQANMYQKDKGDDISKQGAARVALFKSTDLHTCWTLQVNYNTGRFKNKIINKGPLVQKFTVNSIKKGLVLDYFGQDNIASQQFYSVQSFQQIGKSIIQSFVDFYELLSNSSRIYSSAYRNMNTLKLNLASSILKMIPFKFDQSTRKLLHKLRQQQTVFEALKQLSLIIDNNNPKIPSNQSEYLQNQRKSSLNTKQNSQKNNTKVTIIPLEKSNIPLKSKKISKEKI